MECEKHAPNIEGNSLELPDSDVCRVSRCQKSSLCPTFQPSVQQLAQTQMRLETLRKGHVTRTLPVHVNRWDATWNSLWNGYSCCYACSWTTVLWLHMNLCSYWRTCWEIPYYLVSFSSWYILASCRPDLWCFSLEEYWGLTSSRSSNHDTMYQGVQCRRKPPPLIPIFQPMIQL